MNDNTGALLPSRFGNCVRAIVTKEIMCPHRRIPFVISVSRACRFGVVRVIFGIPKRVIPLCFRTLSEIFFVNF